MGTYDRSIFNELSYKAAVGDDTKNGYAVVRIKPNSKRVGADSEDIAITGIIDQDGGGVSFDIPINWTTLSEVAGSIVPNGISNFIDTANKVGVTGGVAEVGAAYSSKQIYTKSGYLAVRVNMTVVDWDGDGTPIAAARLLSTYCMPVYVGDLITLMKDATDKIATSENAVGLVVGAIKSGSEGISSTLGSIVQKGKGVATNLVGKDIVSNSGQIANNIVKTLSDDLDDLVTLRSSPVPVTLTISNYFEHPDMIIKTLSYTFSKECTINGPLYVKFDISLSSRKVMVEPKDNGLVQNIGVSRVTNSTINFTGVNENGE